jgi:hypothetical protein
MDERTNWQASLLAVFANLLLVKYSVIQARNRSGLFEIRCNLQSVIYNNFNRNLTFVRTLTCETQSPWTVNSTQSSV